jgi:hypothetical protein
MISAQAMRMRRRGMDPVYDERPLRMGFHEKTRIAKVKVR